MRVLGVLSLLLAEFGCARAASEQDRAVENAHHTGNAGQTRLPDVPALIHLLESQLQLKRLAEAHQTVRMLEESLQARDPRLFQVATTLALNEDYAAAVPLLERIHQALPQVYDISYNLALAHYRSANYDKAVETLRSLTHQQDRAEVD